MSEPAIELAALALCNGQSDTLGYLSLPRTDFIVATAVIAKANEMREREDERQAIRIGNALARSFK